MMLTSTIHKQQELPRSPGPALSAGWETLQFMHTYTLAGRNTFA